MRYFCVGRKSCFQWFQMWKQLSDGLSPAPAPCGRAYFLGELRGLAVRVSAPFCCLGAHCCPVLGSAQRGPWRRAARAELSAGASPVGSQAVALGVGPGLALSALRLEAVCWGGEQSPHGLWVQMADLSASCLSTTDGGALGCSLSRLGPFCLCALRRLPASVPESCCSTGPVSWAPGRHREQGPLRPSSCWRQGCRDAPRGLPLSHPGPRGTRL